MMQSTCLLTILFYNTIWTSLKVWDLNLSLQRSIWFVIVSGFLGIKGQSDFQLYISPVVLCVLVFSCATLIRICHICSGQIFYLTGVYCENTSNCRMYFMQSKRSNDRKKDVSLVLTSNSQSQISIVLSRIWQMPMSSEHCDGSTQLEIRIQPISFWSFANIENEMTSQNSNTSKERGDKQT